MLYQPKLLLQSSEKSAPSCHLDDLLLCSGKLLRKNKYLQGCFTLVINSNVIRFVTLHWIEVIFWGGLGDIFLGEVSKSELFFVYHKLSHLICLFWLSLTWTGFTILWSTTEYIGVGSWEDLQKSDISA